MSNLGSQNTGNVGVVNSALSASDVNYALNAVSTSIEMLGDSIGDLNGHGPSNDNSFKTSLSGAIGDASKIAIDLPLGAEFSSYTDTFTTDDKSDFILSLIPSSQLTIHGNIGVTYVEAQGGSLENSNEYVISGRRLIFHTKPSGSFSVVYSGVYPSIEGVNQIGYMPNIYPSPKLIESGNQDRAEIDRFPNGVFELTVSPPNRNSYGDIFSSRLEYALSDKLTGFISPTGGTECPSEHISIWKLFNGRFQKITDAKVSILAPNKVRFQTGIDIDENTDILVICLNNWTISDTVDALIKYMTTHSHSSDSLGSQIRHGDNTELRSMRYVNGLREFGVSKIRGDDHSQYFHRDGYIEDNSGNFNNAILGDVLIGSTNDFNLYNNSIDSSRKIYFGSTTDANSIMYDAVKDALKVYGSKNGLVVESHAPTSDTNTKYGIGLEIDEHKIYSYGGVDKEIGGVISRQPNEMIIAAKDNIVRFMNSISGSDVFAKLFSSKDSFVSDTLYLTEEESRILIGRSSFRNIGGNVLVESDDDHHISFNAHTKFNTVEIKTLTPEVLTIQGNGRIQFGPNNKSNIRAIGDTIDISSNKAVSFSNSGRNTGMSIKSESYYPFTNIYSSSEGGGSSTPTDHDTYIESGDGETFFIKSSEVPQVRNGVTYTFGDSSGTRIDNLKYWVRSNISAGEADLYSVNVETSSLSDRRGVNFGDVSAIYTTGTDTECPPGWLVLESKNGVVLTDSRTGAMDCQNIVYSELTSGPIKVFGDVTVDESIGVSGNIDSGGRISSDTLVVSQESEFGSITVNEDSRFTGSVSFTENVNINSQLSVGGSIDTNNRLTANELEVNSRSKFAGPVEMEASLNSTGNISVEGSITTGGDIRSDAKITARDALLEEATIYKLKTTDSVVASGGVEASGKITSSGNIETESDVIAAGGRFSTQVRTGNLIVESEASVGGEFYVSGKFQAAGDITLGSSGKRLSVNSDAIFNNQKTSFLGTLDVSDDSFMKGQVSVTGNAKFVSSVAIGGELNISGPIISEASADLSSLRVHNQTQLLGDVNIGERLSINKSLSVNDGFVVKGDATIGNDNSIVVIGGRAQFNRDVGFTGKVNMSGDTSISGNASITGQLLINSRTTIEGEIVGGGNATIAGIATVNSIKAKSQAEFDGGLLSSKTIQTESLNVNSSAVFQSGVKVEGESQFFGGITTSPNSSSNFGILNVNGGINQSDNKSNNQLAGNTMFNNDVSIAKDLQVKGSIMTGSSESGCFIQNNMISLIGNTSSVITKNAVIDVLEGRSKINISLPDTNSIVSSKASLFASKDYTKVTSLYVEDTQVNRGDLMCLGTLYVGSIQTIEIPGSNNIFDENSSTLNMRVARARYAP